MAIGRAIALAVLSMSATMSASRSTSTASAFVAHRRQRSRFDATKLRYISLEQVSDFYQNFPLQSAVLTCGVKASVADTIAQVKPQIEENKNKKKQQEQQEQLQMEQASVESSNTTSIVSSHESLRDEASSNQYGTTMVRDFDWEARRNLAYVLYGGIFVGAMSHVEYSCVFPLLFGSEKTAAITTEKVFFDNLLVAPTVWLPPAYFIKAWVYGVESNHDDDESGDEPKGILAEGLEKYLVDVKDNHLLWKYWAIWFPAQTVSFSVVPDHLRVAFMASISFFWFILFSSVSSQGDGDNTTNDSN